MKKVLVIINVSLMILILALFIYFNTAFTSCSERAFEQVCQSKNQSSVGFRLGDDGSIIGSCANMVNENGIKYSTEPPINFNNNKCSIYCLAKYFWIRGYL